MFLLMRDCGEDCSAADANRSSDSRDSPLDIVDEGLFRQSTPMGMLWWKGGWEVLPKRYRQRSPVRLCPDRVGRGLSHSHPPWQLWEVSCTGLVLR